MNYSDEELQQMLYVIGESEGNCVLAARIYNQRYPNLRQPQLNTFRRVKTRFEGHSSVKYLPPVKQNHVLTENRQLDVLMAVVEQPAVSQRKITQIYDISKSSVQRVLKQNKFHAYHPQIVQELREGDYDRRMQYCHWALNNITDDPNFFENVLFTDESTFHKSALPNRHNSHQYANTNPHGKIERKYQGRWSINVWGGIIGSRLIGPYFFDENLNGAVYLNFLRNNLNILLEDVPLLTRRRMWYQHDGAPPHYTHEVTNFLNRRFPNRWIGRGGPVAWPARSPDLTPLDFSLWGYIKNIVYNHPPTTVEDMRLRIIRAFEEAPVQMLRNIQASYARRLEFCLNENGHHFEHLLN